MDKKIAELQEKVTAAKSKVKSMENSRQRSYALNTTPVSIVYILELSSLKSSLTSKDAAQKLEKIEQEVNYSC